MTFENNKKKHLTVIFDDFFSELYPSLPFVTLSEAFTSGKAFRHWLSWSSFPQISLHKVCPADKTCFTEFRLSASCVALLFQAEWKCFWTFRTFLFLNLPFRTFLFKKLLSNICSFSPSYFWLSCHETFLCSIHFSFFVKLWMKSNDFLWLLSTSFIYFWHLFINRIVILFCTDHLQFPYFLSLISNSESNLVTVSFISDDINNKNKNNNNRNNSNNNKETFRQMFTRFRSIFRVATLWIVDSS